SRIGKNFGAQGDIGFSRGISSHRAGSSGSIASQLDLADKNVLGRSRTHQQQYEVRRLTAQLQAKASTFKGHHRWSAPASLKGVAGSASHHTTPVTTADPDGKFNHRWQNHDAIRLVDHALRDVVGNVHNLLDNFSCV